jgi:NDP-sugar pyrophosphorylase family protein
MAGGKGLRLHALTQHRPKPMLPVGNKPLLQTIIERFAAQGFRQFYIAVNYKAELIEGYFGDGSAFGVSIEYLRETEPLGTAGALRLLPELFSDFIVSNADVLAEIDYTKFLAAHCEHDLDATVALGLYQHQVPYGVIECNGAVVRSVAEKPIKNYLVNAGIYVLPAKVQRMIPNGPYDMPALLNRLTVGAYAIEGYWYDVGQFADLAAAHINWSLKVA